MKKLWVKNSDFNYSLWEDEKEIGKMEIQFNTIASKAVCNIDGLNLEIKRTGFWKSNLEVTDSNGAVVLKTHPEKWYANTSIIEFKNNKYRLIIRNNPLAEFAVIENDSDVLAYGLNTQDGELKVRISTSDNILFLISYYGIYFFLLLLKTLGRLILSLFLNSYTLFY